MFTSRKHIFFWLISIIATIMVAYFQRTTGPSYPLKSQSIIAGTILKYKLPRTAITGKSLAVNMNAELADGATLKFRRLNSQEDWIEIPMVLREKQFSATIPSQPPAGKVEYQITIQKNGQEHILPPKSPVIARFRGSVPAWLLILHILFMFASLIFATRCLFAPWDSHAFNKNMAWTTTIIMFVGGMILGPLVQKYAFGQFWTGLPFGTDLTDNKTLFILLLWVITLFIFQKRKYILSITSIMTLIIFLIPHSILGSELDHRTGQYKNTFSHARFIQQADLPPQNEHTNIA